MLVSRGFFKFEIKLKKKKCPKEVFQGEGEQDAPTDNFPLFCKYDMVAVLY